MLQKVRIVVILMWEVGSGDLEETGYEDFWGAGNALFLDLSKNDIIAVLFTITG